jgi:hypothetical protein
MVENKSSIGRYSLAAGVLFGLCIAVGLFGLGLYLGERNYKKGCEPMSHNASRVEWLECQP